MSTPSLGIRLLAGVGAGLAGTVGIHGLMTATGKWLPEGVPPMRQDPAEFIWTTPGLRCPRHSGNEFLSPRGKRPDACSRLATVPPRL